MSLAKIQRRVIWGIVFYLGSMILLGWVFINEEGRMQAFTQQYHARSIENGAQLFQNSCAPCHSPDALGLTGVAPALLNPKLFNGERLKEANWTGSLADYIRSAIASGRPLSGSYWPNPMPFWGQTFGGPLRPDQVNDLTNYILNFREQALDPDNPPQINQDFVLPGAPAAAGGADLGLNASGQPVGTDVTGLDLAGGDPTRGQAVYSALGCIGCHLAGVVAPLTEGTYTRAAEVRLNDPAVTDQTAEEYLAHSIVATDAYIVPGFPGGLMPTNFGERLDLTDLRDLVAYLATQDQPLPPQ